MASIPNLWNSSHGYLHRDRLRREASAQARAHALPLSAEELSGRLSRLRTALVEKLRLELEESPLDLQIHGAISQPGYVIQKVSFLSSPGIRVLGNLFIPEGPGPFPAVLNLHGHLASGKVAERVQGRGHILARNGFVTLSVDAAGSGERSEVEREWSYHGAMKGAELLLGGDSLMGQQIRDNRRAVDVLQSLPFVDPNRIGATGESGGGNQTMWVTAMDERIRACVPVVSVGSFEVYVTERNCMCETLPGALALAEEWEVLGLIAPRPLLILNALHDRAAFGYEAMSATCRQLEEVYTLGNARERLDWRILDMTHGYHAAPLQAMLGWMRHWLAGAPESSLVTLPDWAALPESELLCYAPGERPEEAGYRAVRRARRLVCEGATIGDENARRGLAKLIGWKNPAAGEWIAKRTLASGVQAGSIFTNRELPLPVAVSGDWGTATDEIRLILSPEGKRGTFVIAEWNVAFAEGALAITADLPGTGELAWEENDIPHATLHDTARACLWLGYTLVGEWAEAIATLGLTLRDLAPNVRVCVIAEREAALAVWIARALRPDLAMDLGKCPLPPSVLNPPTPSLAWCIPGFLPWGDLPLLRQLAGDSNE